MSIRPPRRILVSGIVFLALAGATPALAQLTFTKAFSPTTIGPGSTSTLTFAIDNTGSGTPVTDLAFTDVLPLGVVIATPASAVTSCGGGAILSAPAGGSTITLSMGDVAGSSTCAVSVNVTGSTAGTHTNTSGDLTSSAGNSGTASADLTVATDRPGFTKSFSPSPISRGARSTLTFTIDNSANASAATDLTFSDALPIGAVIADPTNAATTCSGGLVTAVPGSNVVAYGPVFIGDGSVAAMSTCTVSVDVIGTGSGMLDNVSSDLTSRVGGVLRSSGMATATFDVTTTTLGLIKSFTDDPVVPGGTVTLEFTVENRDRNFSATGIGFTDNLGATLAGLAPTGPLPTNPCGAGSALTFASPVLTLTGGTVGAAGSCTFQVSLLVPIASVPGAYPNTTSAVTGTIGGSPVTGNVASETLYVTDAPTLTKSFQTDPIGAGDSVMVDFTITNTSSTFTASAFAFSDNLSAFISGISVTSLPAAGFCGAGSSMTAALIGGELHLIMSGGTLAASASCTFSVGLQLPLGTPSGTHTNTTSNITATVSGSPRTGQPAADTLTVVGAPRLQKSFTNDPVLPGATVNLEFTIIHDVTATADATSIGFTDNLTVTLSGLTATVLPTNPCGAGSTLTGTTTLTLAGGTLTPGSSCTFSATLQVPLSALPGVYPNTTSDLTATVSGLTVTRGPAQDDLDITGLSMTKAFIDDPILPGGTGTLRFTVNNTHPGPSPTGDATGIFFTDSLTTALPGLTAVAPLPTTPCGAGSTITGTTFLIFSGGILTAGTSCTFDVAVMVPAAAADGIYNNLTSAVAATVNGTLIGVPPASDTLTVLSALLATTKSFTDDPVAPGSTVTLEFTIINLHPTLPATAIAFTDDLGATLTGLAPTGPLPPTPCGGGSTLTYTAPNLILAGGNLAAAGSCTFQVSLLVPGAATAGLYPNTTSTVTGTVGGLGATGGPATDDLVVLQTDFTKSFSGPTVAGGTLTLSFTIDNLDPSATISNLGFTDNLDAVVSGLVATGLPQNNDCGTGSQIAGTSLLTFSGGTVGPASSCTINVTLQVPAAATAGSFPNTTSDLSSSGLTVASPATDNLDVEPPPTFSKSFAPANILPGAVSTLTFTIDNTASALAASALDFTDNLPAAVTVASPSNATTSCTGGTLTAVSGTGVITYTGGQVNAGSSCSVQVDVTSATGGMHLNTTGDLTSSSGNSGPASATLQVGALAAPAFGKSFSPGTINFGDVGLLTFTIDNTTTLVAATGLTFTDNLPAGVVVATPPNASTTCVGGTITAVAGTGVVTYSAGSVPAASSCDVQVDITSTTPGTYVNTTNDLTSSSGNSGPATSTLVVAAASVIEIPTLGVWGLMLLAGLLALVALWQLNLR